MSVHYLSRSVVQGALAVAAMASAALVPNLGNEAWAGTFSMTQFVAPGEFAIGIEPEVTLSDGAGVATNVKFTQGLSDLSNFIGTIGTGTGPQEFRVGAGLTFDFFPDIDGQAGIGLGTQGTYYRLDMRGQMETTAIPYVHKTFHSGDNEIEPFFALPVGLQFSDGQYQATSSASIGSMFKGSEHFRYVMELGLGLNNAQSYLSGGIVYYH